MFLTVIDYGFGHINCGIKKKKTNAFSHVQVMMSLKQEKN